MNQTAAMIGNLDDPVGTDLVIGLVNNMPKPALQSTEQEFRALLNGVQLRCFVLPGAAAPAAHYEPLAALFDPSRNNLPLDGLIVTGTEPVAARLADEPYWPQLARLVDWAAENTISTIWSCLAAQAAVLRLDGIERRLLPGKLSGVFTCVKASDHALLSGAPGCWPVPHSRLNDIDEYVLAARGYQILSRAPRLGADSFIKQAGRSLFLMLQGHPEYGADCLLREYRRDIRRFLQGQRQTWPDPPEHYFDSDTKTTMAYLRELAAHRSSRDIMTRFDAAATQPPPATWHAQANRLYANWLTYLADRKTTASMTAHNTRMAAS